jgi:hypothetical protein
MELNLDWRRRASALWPEVSYELRPLRVWAFQELLVFWEAQGVAGSNVAPGGTAPALVSSARLMEVARRIFPDHVRGLAGLHARGEDGAPAPVAVPALCEEAALLPLAAEIVAALVEISTLDAAAEKN